MNFDQYQRYETVRRLVEHVRSYTGAKHLSILEIGANANRILEKLLPDDEILYSDISLPEELLNDPHFMVLDATDMRGLQDDHFDLVVALDVLEHIPTDSRDKVVSEMGRVASKACIVCFPYDSKANKEAEFRANEHYRVIFGKPHIWLQEHIDNGLPAITDIQNAFEEKSLANFHFEHGDVNVWEELIKALFYTYYTIDALPYLASIDNIYIDKLYATDLGEDNYRTYFVSAKDTALLASLRDFSSALFTPPTNDKNLRVLQRCLDGLVNVCQLPIPRDQRPGHIDMKLYVDYGEGFSEENSTICEVMPGEDGDFKVHYTLLGGVREVRFDPVDGYACLLQNFQVLLNGRLIEKELTFNALKVDNLLVFDTIDSQVHFPPNGESGDLLFCGRIFIYKDLPVAPMISVFSNEHIRLRQTHVYLEKEFSTLQDTYTKLCQVNAELENEQALLQEKTTKMKDRLAVMEANETELQQRYREVVLSYEGIRTSKFWRMTKPLRKLVDTMRGTPAVAAISSDTGSVVPIRFSLDNVTTDAPVLAVSGWAFCETGPTEDLRLRIHCKGKDYLVDTVHGLAREDVMNSTGNGNSLASGFYASVLCIGAASFTVYLRLTCNGETDEVLLTEIEMPKADETATPSFTAMSETKIPSTSFDQWVETHVLKESVDKFTPYKGTVDIILPIYNGYHYLEKLFASIPLTDIDYRLIVIEDCSTDERVWPYLQKTAAADKRIILLQNETNQGFVKTVNRGFSLAENDVALINSDIELPRRWLERLMRPILQNDDVASSTPFTNCGTLCSFPDFGKDCEVFEGLSCQEVDDAFAVLQPAYVEMPTGVGFCMGMSAKALAAVGIFDAETFSKGYGEENDWCQRAIQKGYRNIMVENLFVYHKHGASFPSEEKQALIEKNSKALSAKHPNYNRDVALFFELDPAKNYRSYAIIALLSAHNNAPVRLAFNHDWGGGATAFLNTWQDEALTHGDKVLLVQYNTDRKIYYFSYMYGSYTARFRLRQLKDLDLLLQMTGVTSISINELVSYPQLEKTLEYILSIKKKFQCPTTYFLHDFYSICPTINMVDRTAMYYYALAGTDKCDAYLADNPYNHYPAETSILHWRQMWQAFLLQMDELVAFSDSTADIVRDVYPNIGSIEVRPHKVTPLPLLENRFKTTDTINIGLVGVLNQIKGYKVIEDMLQLAEKDNRKVRFVLLGYSMKEFFSTHYTETGTYTVENLPRMMLENDIDVVFIASTCPETFSFTTAEAIQMGLPVASFDMGAQGGHVRKAKNGLLLPGYSGKEAYEPLVAFAKKMAAARPKPEKKDSVLFVVEYETFSSRYRVSHFREEMLFKGITSDMCLSNKVDTVDMSAYSALVIYRCPYTASLTALIEKAHEQGKKVFYDIDDFIFDYRAIGNVGLSMHKGEEYRDYSARINQCMKQCDGYLSSTNTLAELIQNEMKKPVCINRNVASMEMVVASEQASPRRPDENVVLGYFSGTNTHNKDFAIMQPVLVSILKKYPQVNLLIVGPMELPTQLKPFNNRIMRHGLVDWRELPQLIAGIDINLMPMEDSLFHRSKSENKWMEAALVKVPTVLSDNSEMRQVIIDGETGMLCKDAAEFETALSTLVEDEAKRREIAEKAYAEVHQSHITCVAGAEAIHFVLDK